MKILPVNISDDELWELEQLHREHGKGWPPAFSSRTGKPIWPKTNNGLTPECNRLDVSETSGSLRHLARLCSYCKDNGGRFFLSGRGAYFKSSKTAEIIYFAEWTFPGEVESKRLSALLRAEDEVNLSYSDLCAQIQENRRKLRFQSAKPVSKDKN